MIVTLVYLLSFELSVLYLAAMLSDFNMASKPHRFSYVVQY